MIETLIITVLIVAICLALLAIKIIFKKNGRFPNTHVSGSKAMRKRGIGCVQSQDREARAPKRIQVRERVKRVKSEE
ncbi:MAG: hypothetical protein IKK67_05835 [Bacteroidaceae bacterium]|nr:hypothetical protein [Bacteroidaceae bacterium]